MRNIDGLCNRLRADHSDHHPPRHDAPVRTPAALVLWRSARRAGPRAPDEVRHIVEHRRQRAQRPGHRANEAGMAGMAGMADMVVGPGHHHYVALLQRVGQPRVCAAD